MRFKELTESSLSRIWRHNLDHDCAAIAGTRKARECGEGERYTAEENKHRNKQLLAKLKVRGYSVTRLIGRYPESGQTIVENSFFVVDQHDTGSLFEDMITFGQIFDQDSVLLVPKGAIQNEAQAVLYSTNNCPNNFIGKIGEEMPFDLAKLGVESPIYTSYVNDRPFYFEDVEGEIPNPGSGMGTWAMHKVAESEVK